MNSAHNLFRVLGIVVSTITVEVRSKWSLFSPSYFLIDTAADSWRRYCCLSWKLFSLNILNFIFSSCLWAAWETSPSLLTIADFKQTHLFLVTCFKLSLITYTEGSVRFVPLQRHLYSALQEAQFLAHYIIWPRKWQTINFHVLIILYNL